MALSEFITYLIGMAVGICIGVLLERIFVWNKTGGEDGQENI